MTTWFWSLLTILTLMGGCAPGYYDTGPRYQAEAAYYRDPGLYRNYETQSDQQMRLWSEEAGR